MHYRLQLSYTLLLTLISIVALAQNPYDEPTTALDFGRTSVITQCGFDEYTLAGATPSIPARACNGLSPVAEQNDIYVRFQASQSEITIRTNPIGVNNEGRIELLDAQLNVLDCTDFFSSEKRWRRSDLSPDSVYFLRMYSAVPTRSIRLRMCSYETPTCIAPTIGARVQEHDFIEWTVQAGDADSVRVELYVAPDDPFRSSPLQSKTISGNRVVFFGLQPGVSYSAFGKAFCGQDSTLYSNRRSARTPTATANSNDSLAQASIAGSVTSSCFPQYGSTAGATGEGSSPGSCTNAASVDDDLWYRHRPQASEYRFEVVPVDGDTADLVLEYYDLSGMLIGCADNERHGTDPEVLQLTDLTVDETYRVRVYTKSSGQAANFALCNVRTGNAAAAATVDTACLATAAVDFDFATGDLAGLVPIIGRDFGRVIAIDSTADLGQVIAYYRGELGTDLPRAANGAAYAARRISLVPERQPAVPVRVRLYYSEAEVLALLAQYNLADPSALAVTRVVNSLCATRYPGGGVQESITAWGRVGNDYWVELEVGSFSEFFLHSASVPLDGTVSIEQASIIPLAVSPNPVAPNSVLRLSVQEAVEAITLLDVTGRRVRSWSPHLRELPLGTLPVGTYALQVRTGAGVGSRLVVIR